MKNIYIAFCFFCIPVFSFGQITQFDTIIQNINIGLEATNIGVYNTGNEQKIWIPFEDYGVVMDLDGTSINESIPELPNSIFYETHFRSQLGILKELAGANWETLVDLGVDPIDAVRVGEMIYAIGADSIRTINIGTNELEAFQLPWGFPNINKIGASDNGDIYIAREIDAGIYMGVSVKNIEGDNSSIIRLHSSVINDNQPFEIADIAVSDDDQLFLVIHSDVPNGLNGSAIMERVGNYFVEIYSSTKQAVDFALVENNGLLSFGVTYEDGTMDILNEKVQFSCEKTALESPIFQYGGSSRAGYLEHDGELKPAALYLNTATVYDYDGDTTWVSHPTLPDASLYEYGLGIQFNLVKRLTGNSWETIFDAFGYFEDAVVVGDSLYACDDQFYGVVDISNLPGTAVESGEFPIPATTGNYYNSWVAKDPSGGVVYAVADNVWDIYMMKFLGNEEFEMYPVFSFGNDQPGAVLDIAISSDGYKYICYSGGTTAGVVIYELCPNGTEWQQIFFTSDAANDFTLVENVDGTKSFFLTGASPLWASQRINETPTNVIIPPTLIVNAPPPYFAGINEIPLNDFVYSVQGDYSIVQFANGNDYDVVSGGQGIEVLISELTGAPILVTIEALYDNGQGGTDTISQNVPLPTGNHNNLFPIAATLWGINDILTTNSNTATLPVPLDQMGLDTFVVNSSTTFGLENISFSVSGDEISLDCSTDPAAGALSLGLVNTYTGLIQNLEYQLGMVNVSNAVFIDFADGISTITTTPTVNLITTISDNATMPFVNEQKVTIEAGANMQEYTTGTFIVAQGATDDRDLELTNLLDLVDEPTITFKRYVIKDGVEYLVDELVVENTVSTNEIQAITLSLFPNPVKANELISFELPIVQTTKQWEIQILDAAGKLIKKEQSLGNAISIQAPTTIGNYTIQVQNEGGFSYIGRLIVIK